MKSCSRCGVTKPLDAFARNKASPDGRHSVCRECRAIQNKERRAKPDYDQAREAALSKARYERRKEALATRRRERYAANREAVLAQNREYWLRNTEAQRERCRKWAREHPEAMRLIVRRRRATSYAAEGFHTQADIDSLFMTQRGQCVGCGCDLYAGYHVDHVVPISRGGGDGADNLQLLCPLCNRRKADKLPNELPHGFYHAAP